MLSANIPALSTKCLQNSCKLVSVRVQQINEKDMQEIKKTLIDINKYRNQTSPNVIDIEGDGIFNYKLYSGVGKTPFQPSTKTVYMVAKNSTPDKQIIACAA